MLKILFEFGAVQKCGTLAKCWNILFWKINFDTAQNEPRLACYMIRARDPWFGIISFPAWMLEGHVPLGSIACRASYRSFSDFPLAKRFLYHETWRSSTPPKSFCFGLLRRLGTQWCSVGRRGRSRVRGPPVSQQFSFFRYFTTL